MWAPVVAPAAADHLLFSEVVTKTRIIGSGRLGSEFIEVVNPTLADIDLSDVYLTDGIFATSSTFYWNIADGVPSTATIGGGAFNDFHVRFPAGYVLVAGDTLSISINGSNQYAEAYGQLPDLELYEDANAPDSVPEMVAVFPGSVHGGDPLGETDWNILPTLSDASESLILYSWDGISDLVADVDFVFWGTSTNNLFDKTGVSVGAGTYLADTAVGIQVAISPMEQNFAQAYARLTAGEGTETTTGGNGVSGHDETSENLGTTWQIASVQNPPAAPSVPFAAAPIFTAGNHFPNLPYANQDVALAIDVVSNSALSGVQFHYTVDGGLPIVVMGNFGGASRWTAVLPGQQEAALVTWYAVATNVVGGTATWPAAAPVFNDYWTVGAEPDPSDLPTKLLITEVSTMGSDQEFVEIANPGPVDVDLSDYYLTDAIYSPGNQVYWRIAEGNPTSVSIGGGVFADFHARFPADFTIAAGDTIVMSIGNGSWYFNAFGFAPDLELWTDDSVPNAVVDMRWVFGDSINNSIVTRTGLNPSTPSLTNAAESIVLYHWDGHSDAVTDIDIFIWKDPTATSTSFLFSKTGVTIGSHSYLPDTVISAQTPFGQQTDFGVSYHRVDAGEGNQITAGSNGVLGRDETSEDLPNTFALLPWDPARGGAVIIPAEGDWQFVGSGPLVQYGSVAHSWGDFDHDGNDDLFLVRPEPGAGNILIHNPSLGGLSQVESFGQGGAEGATDCIRGDFNQDGDLDLYVTMPDAQDWLFTNYGQEWGWQLYPWPADVGGVIATTGAEAVDTDLDGWLEIFVTNGTGTNQLLDGRFGLTDFLPHSLDHLPGTLGSTFCDLDGDRDPDLSYISADGGLAISYQDEPRRFSEQWLPAPVTGRDLAWADFDNDGDFDFVLLRVGDDNLLHENRGDGTFAVTALTYTGAGEASGCNWGDFDNDGFSDLFVTYRGGENVLWRNDGAGDFTAVVDTVLANGGHVGNNAASSWLDIDRDGDLDLYLSNQEIANRIVRNNLDLPNNWLHVSVAGQHWGNQSNLAAVGAMIEVEAGGIVQRRYVGGGEAGTGHAPLLQHFGLGSAASVDRVAVHWPFRLPNGAFHSTVWHDVAVNQRIVIEESAYGVSAVGPVAGFRNSLMGAQPNPFNPATVIAYSLEQAAVVDLDIFDVRGRLVRRLVSGETEGAGEHQVTWRGESENGAEVASGVYFYRLKAGAYLETKRLALIK